MRWNYREFGQETAGEIGPLCVPDWTGKEVLASSPIRSMARPMGLTSIEICAGAGGQALGLEQAGFEHLAAVEIDRWACATLRANRPSWNVVGPTLEDPAPFEEGPGDVKVFSADRWKGQVDLLAGGVPCPPFSVAGKQLGKADERDLFPEAIRLVGECEPRAVLLENVRGLGDPKFESYRETIVGALDDLGYEARWKLVHASDHNVPQLRPRMLLVAFRGDGFDHFQWPDASGDAPTVGETLKDLMSANGWSAVDDWASGAGTIGPTLVGGSKKHGGPDLGPTRARKAWAELGVDGRGVANEAPAEDFEGMPRLTVRMTARIQGFPDSWEFSGGKTAQYRQVGNAFPPPVAKAVGLQISAALEAQEASGYQSEPLAA